MDNLLSQTRTCRRQLRCSCYSRLFHVVHLQESGNKLLAALTPTIAIELHGSSYFARVCNGLNTDFCWICIPQYFVTFVYLYYGIWNCDFILPL